MVEQLVAFQHNEVLISSKLPSLPNMQGYPLKTIPLLLQLLLDYIYKKKILDSSCQHLQNSPVGEDQWLHL